MKIGKGTGREMKRSGKDEMRKGRHLERTRVHELIRTECMKFISMLYSNQRLGTRGNKCKNGHLGEAKRKRERLVDRTGKL